MINFDLISHAIDENTLSQKDINKQADEFIQKVKDGEISAIQLRYELKVIENVIKKVGENDDLRNYSLTESKNYDSKIFNYRNSEVKISELGTKYDYSSCSAWNETHSREELYANKRKEIETQMRTKEGFIDKKTGEVLHAKKVAGKENLSFFFNLKTKQNYV